MNMPREIAPPPEIRDAVALRLRRNRLLRARRPWLGIAAAALLAVTALVLWIELRPAATPQPRYILLLYEGPQFSGGSHEEYAQWARSMRPLVVGGEELSNNALMTIGTKADTLAGYFLIDARDDATAERVARACPHLKHGGGVILRRIMQGARTSSCGGQAARRLRSGSRQCRTRGAR